MKANKNIIAAIILGACMIIAALLYFEANRYEVNAFYRIDKYKGEYKELQLKNN